MKSRIKKEDSVFGEDNTNEPIPLRSPNNEKKTPIKHIKYPVIVISTVLIFGGLVFFNMDESASTTENVTTSEERIFVENINAEKIAMLESTLAIFQTDIDRVSFKIEGLTNELSHFARREEVLLHAEAADISKNIQLIQSDISRIDNAFVKVKKRLKKSELVGRRKKINVAFNFDIDGLGSWGGKPFLSIGYRGKYKMMEIGEKINGWELIDLDLVSRVAVFKHITGRSIKRHV